MNRTEMDLGGIPVEGYYISVNVANFSVVPKLFRIPFSLV